MAVLRGISTVRFHAADLAKAKEWYSEFLGIEPYFNRPEYVEFRLGDYQHELGLLDSRFAADLGGKAGEGGAVVYWHVDDLAATVDRLLAMGAKLHEPIRKFGEGFSGASVIDPFGNILGLMYNAHYLEILGAK